MELCEVKKKKLKKSKKIRAHSKVLIDNPFSEIKSEKIFDLEEKSTTQSGGTPHVIGTKMAEELRGP